jgi:hypothetical protein
MWANFGVSYVYWKITCSSGIALVSETGDTGSTPATQGRRKIAEMEIVNCAQYALRIPA